MTLIDQAVLIRLHDEIAQLRKENETLRAERAALRQASIDAHTDELTGLYNRRWLRRFWNQLPAPGMALSAVVQIDVDHFKSINDRYGHKVGDHAIVHVSYALRRHCARVVRTGGDEFILLIPREQNPRGVAQAILAEVRSPMPVPSGSLTTTVSIGVCQLDEAAKCLDLSDIAERADEAMYRAKRLRGDQMIVV